MKRKLSALFNSDFRSWLSEGENINYNYAAPPGSDTIQDTPENRRIFHEALRKFLLNHLNNGRYDEEFDRFFTEFVKGGRESYSFTLCVSLVDNDRVFMKMLIDETRNAS